MQLIHRLRQRRLRSYNHPYNKQRYQFQIISLKIMPELRLKHFQPHKNIKNNSKHLTTLRILPLVNLETLERHRRSVLLVTAIMESIMLSPLNPILTHLTKYLLWFHFNKHSKLPPEHRLLISIRLPAKLAPAFEGTIIGDVADFLRHIRDKILLPAPSLIYFYYHY